jgi:hypothetical protein
MKTEPTGGSLLSFAIHPAMLAPPRTSAGCEMAQSWDGRALSPAILPFACQGPKSDTFLIELAKCDRFQSHENGSAFTYKSWIDTTTFRPPPAPCGKNHPAM